MTQVQAQIAAAAPGVAASPDIPSPVRILVDFVLLLLSVDSAHSRLLIRLSLIERRTIKRCAFVFMFLLLVIDLP